MRVLVLLALVACERAVVTGGTVKLGDQVFTIDLCESGATYGIDDGRMFRAANDASYRIGHLMVSPRAIVSRAPQGKAEPPIEAVGHPRDCKTFVNERDRVRLDCGEGEQHLTADLRVGECP